ncbi:hypothetical protein DPX16_22649 [Anabarilius grahami]|uniref:Uncharacterized protein n=1 Tax=Anabarilius grahami TaxID=495550 RepID=A0A3N0XJV6_ANAGA|nr:hypothetical protein DPX16_22649 [Anabarilius grahami]
MKRWLLSSKEKEKGAEMPADERAGSAENAEGREEDEPPGLPSTSGRAARQTHAPQTDHPSSKARKYREEYINYGFTCIVINQVTHNLQLLLLSPDKNIACGTCGVWKVTGVRSHASLTRNIMAVIDKPEGQSTHVSHKERDPANNESRSNREQGLRRARMAEEPQVSSTGRSGSQRTHISVSTQHCCGTGIFAPSKEGSKVASSVAPCRFAVSRHRAGHTSDGVWVPCRCRCRL